MTDPYGGTSLRIVRDDGRTIVADGQWSGGWAVEWEGLADFLDLPIDLQTSPSVLTDGSMLVSSRVAEAERTATIVYAGPRDPREVRDEALAFFNPKHAFEVHVTHMGRTRWCEGELAARQCVIQPSRYPCRVTFTLLCLDPYMRGEDVHDYAMTDASPFFTFPFRCCLPGPGVSAGCVASVRVYDGLNTVVNSGGVPAPFRVTAKFEQPVTNPTFHVNDKHVTVVRPFAVGDSLVLDFMASPPSVTVNGENAIQSCSRDSNFVQMQLAVGENTFWYEAGSGDVNTMRVSIVYYDRYMGV